MVCLKFGSELNFEYWEYYRVFLSLGEFLFFKIKVDFIINI